VIAAGFVARTGWAVEVVVEGGAVVHRGRADLIGDGAPANVCHVAVDLPLDDARALYERVRDEAYVGARRALASLCAEHGLSAIAIVAGGTAVPDDLAAVLASHPLMHAAEGQVVRDALAEAAHDAGLRVHLVAKGELSAAGNAEQRRMLERSGRGLGPPWRREHTDAALAAALAGS
jgi:hypothetical protein